jgi:hypothetical protein
MVDQKNTTKYVNENILLKECLSDFKANTGYDFCELLQDKNKYHLYIEEDKKKDLRQYTERSKNVLDDVERIYADLNNQVL